MTKVIWKFPLEPNTGEIEVPQGAKLLDIQMQGGVPCIWALVDPNAPKVKVSVVSIGTGQEMHDECIDAYTYLGTFQVHAGLFIWHIFYRFKGQ